MEREDSTRLPPGVVRASCERCLDLFYIAGAMIDEDKLCSACRRAQPVIDELQKIGSLLEEMLRRSAL